MKTLRETLAVLGLLTPIVYLWTHWQSLPAIVPIHYNLQGHANGFAPRNALWLLVAVSITLYLFLLLIARFPMHFNLPRAVGDPGRALDEALAIQLVAWLRFEIAWLFAYIIIQTARSSSNGRPGLSETFTAVVVVVVILTCAIFTWRMRSAKHGAAAN